MKRAPILAEWKRAVESLGAAESCRRDGFYADCVSRTYYAILHGAKAALLIKGVGADSHAAVKRLFGLHVRIRQLLLENGLTSEELHAGTLDG